VRLWRKEEKGLSLKKKKEIRTRNPGNKRTRAPLMPTVCACGTLSQTAKEKVKLLRWKKDRGREPKQRVGSYYWTRREGQQTRRYGNHYNNASGGKKVRQKPRDLLATQKKKRLKKIDISLISLAKLGKKAGLAP